MGISQAVNRLSVLLGHPPGWVDEMLSSVQPVPRPRGEIAIGIPADLLRRRPDIRGAERRVAAATARIGAAVGEMYPQFSITGNFGVDAQDLSSTFTWNSFSANVGPSVRWSVLNFGRLRSNVRAQGARQLQQVVLYQNTVLRAAEEVDNALVAYDQEKRRRESLVEAVAAYRRAVDLSQKQYARGTTSFQRVLDSQRSLLQFQDQLAISNANVSRNLVQLYRALGGGWRLPVEYPITPVENHVLPPPD